MMIRIGAVSSVAWSTGAQVMIFFASDFLWCCLAVQESPTVSQNVVSVESSTMLLHSTVP